MAPTPSSTQCIQSGIMVSLLTFGNWKRGFISFPLSLNNSKKAAWSRLWSCLAIFWLRAFQLSGLAAQSQQQPFSSFHWGAPKAFWFQSQSDLICSRTAFPGMVEPFTDFLFESDASQGEPSCLASGNFPFAKESKLQCMISHMALMVGAPIILASKHVIGILQLEKVELQGKFSVQKSTVLWLILPCTGTPSPNRPIGSMDPCGRPQLSQACANFLA